MAPRSKVTAAPALEPIAQAAQVLARLTHEYCVKAGITLMHEAKDHEARFTSMLTNASKADLAAFGALAP